MNELDSLRALLCGIGVVGNIDGHDVIRRESVIDLVDRALASKPDAAPAIDERQAFEAWLVPHQRARGYGRWLSDAEFVLREKSGAYRSFVFEKAWEAWQARASSAAPAGLSEMNAVQGHEAGRATQGARTEPFAPNNVEPAPTLESAYADGRADQFEDDKELLRWAYGKLRHVAFTKQEDALQLDHINLLLMGGVNHV